MRTSFSAFLFDMDGLLLDTERQSFTCWAAAAREFGYELPLSLFSKMIGRPVAENESLVLQTLGSDFPYWEARARRVALMEELVAEEGVPVRKGAQELVSALHLGGARLAVVTSTERAVAESKLGASGLLPFFEYLIGPEDISRGKPAPDCYLLAATELGVAAESCAVFEDSPAGVEAGVAAGMKVFWVPDLVEDNQRLREIAFRVCKDLDEVADFLRLAENSAS